MPTSCIVCSAVASPELQLQYCAKCQSALYCSKACQRKDWKKQHKQLCKFLNVGQGMQIRTGTHESQSIDLKEAFEETERSLDEDVKRFFKLFEESTEEGSRAAAQKMKKFAKRQTKEYLKLLLFHSLFFLVRSSNSEMLSWPNSPLLVLLQFVDPNVLFKNGEESYITLLHYLAEMADPFNYSTHVNQLILAKQLIDHGAGVNTKSMPDNETPLHKACFAGNVTNLDFIELLLKAGADPNTHDHLGVTPLMHTIPDAPGAAKFLLNWPTTDANTTMRSRQSFLCLEIVRYTVKHYSDKVALFDNPKQIQHQFVLQQWRDIEDILVERGAVDTGITALDWSRDSSSAR